MATIRNKALSETVGNRSTRIGAYLVSPCKIRGESAVRVRIDQKVYGSEKSKFFGGDDMTTALLWAAQQNEKFEKGTLDDSVPRTSRKPDLSRSISITALAFYNDREGEMDKHTLRLYKNHIGKLVQRFGGYDLDLMDPLECRNWIKKLPNTAQRTKHGIYTSCKTFFKWAVRYGHCKSNPFDRMEPIPKGESPKGILTPDQMELALSFVTGFMRDFIVLGGFCGLRPVEIMKSTWKAVNFETGEFHVNPSAIKRDRTRGRGMHERYIEIPPTALALLSRKKNSDDDEKIIPRHYDAIRRRMVRLWQKRMKMKDWPHDCLRHSAATYRYAIVEDANKVAKWLGHTDTSMVHQHYAKAVPRAEADRWWSITEASVAARRATFEELSRR